MYYLTPKEFHARLGGAVSMRTVWRWIANGDIAHAKIRGRVLIPADAVERLIQQPKGE